MPKDQVKINLIAEDEQTGEYVLYLLSDGPWPDNEEKWRFQLTEIQNSILDVFDSVVDGGLAKKYPESIGKGIRIQIDSPSGLPRKLGSLVTAIEEYVHQSNNEYGASLTQSQYVSSLRIVTGHSLGRWP